MTKTHVNTLIVGAGQAGLAMSAHLGKQGVDHLILERDTNCRAVAQRALGQSRGQWSCLA